MFSGWMSDILREIGIATIVAVIMAASVAVWGRVKDKWSWPVMVMNGLFVTACVLTIICVFTVLGKKPPTALAAPTAQPVVEQVTVGNVESKIREWLDAFGLGVRKINIPACYFAYEVSLQTGIPLVIARAKERDHYLTMLARIQMSPEHKALFDQLSEVEKAKFLIGLQLDAAKYKIALEPDATFEKHTIERRVPITSNLTEADLIENIGEVNFAALIIRDTITLDLEVKVRQQPSPTPSMGASPH